MNGDMRYRVDWCWGMSETAYGKSYLPSEESISCKLLLPLPCGVAIAEGSGLLVHYIQLILETNLDWVVLKTDIKNTFT